MEETADGVKFFSPITGQSMTLRDTTFADLDSSHFEWRANQLEDNIAGRMGLSDKIENFEIVSENVFSGKSVAMAGLVDRAPYHTQPEYTGTPIDPNAEPTDPVDPIDPEPPTDPGEMNQVIGDAGDNQLRGSADADWLNGDAGDDILRADAGDDQAYGGDGADIIRGGAGDDVVYGQDGDDIVLSGDRGDDTIYGGAGNDVLRGGADNDMLYGDEGADRLVGDRGGDTLNGGAGDDVLIGHFGDDYLIGGDGFDRLIGGEGADTFKVEGVQGVELIADFEQGADKIDLSFYEIGSFDQLQMSAAGAGGVKIDLGDQGGETVIVRNVELDDLTADDFVI